MIKKQNRLSDKRSVTKVLQRGFAIKKSDLTVRIFKTGTGGARMTVVVSKKISNKAVTRNRIKRRVREAFVPYLDRIQGVSIVAFPKKSAEEADFTLIQAQVRECLENLLSS